MYGMRSQVDRNGNRNAARLVGSGAEAAQSHPSHNRPTNELVRGDPGKQGRREGGAPGSHIFANQARKRKPMKFQEALKLAMQSLWANKLRSILTLIGVVMGVASVIMVITLTNTANDYFGTKLTGYGADVFTLDREGLIFNAEDYFRFQKRKILKMEDFEAIRDGCHSCKEVGALLSKTTNVVHNNHSSTDTGVRGYTAAMFSLNNLNVVVGRALTEGDVEHATRTAVVGYDIVDNLLGDGDPIDKEIRVDGEPYTIVGVGERQGKTFGQSQDNWVAVPLTTYQHTYGSNDSMTIYVRAGINAEATVRASRSDEQSSGDHENAAARCAGRAGQLRAADQ